MSLLERLLNQRTLALGFAFARGVHPLLAISQGSIEFLDDWARLPARDLVNLREEDWQNLLGAVWVPAYNASQAAISGNSKILRRSYVEAAVDGFASFSDSPPCDP